MDFRKSFVQRYTCIDIENLYDGCTRDYFFRSHDWYPCMDIEFWNEMFDFLDEFKKLAIYTNWLFEFFIILILLDEFSKIKFAKIHSVKARTQTSCLAVGHWRHLVQCFLHLRGIEYGSWFTHGYHSLNCLVHLIRQKSPL